MGFIADSAAGKATLTEGRPIWRQVFGRESKEEPARTPPANTFGRSTISTAAAYKRLLDAMRSGAPGGWSDNRWEQTKHFVGIQYVSIHRSGEQLAQAEFQLFRKDPRHPKGKRPVLPGEPGHELIELLEHPNGDDSFGDLMYAWNQQMDLTGMALTWVVPNKLGIPMELYPIPTAIAISQPAVNPDYPDGYYRIQPVYPYGPFSSYPTPASAVGAAIPAQWMLRFKYTHPLLRYEGYSPLTALRLHLDEIESMDRSRWYSMKRSISPSAVLQFDQMDGAQPLPEPEIERIRAEMESDFMGPENAGQLFVSTPGARLEPWGARPVDMDYQSGWDQLVSFAMGGFGITKPAAGMIEDSSYSTLFATLKQFHLLTLKPKCMRIASQLTKHLAKYYGDDLILEIRCPRIDDHELMERKLRLAMDAKAITKNQLLEELELPMTKEEWGDEIAGVDPQQQQQQMGMGGGMAEAAPVAEGQAGEEGAMQEEEVGSESLASLLDMDKTDEIEKARDEPNRLGRGALGPPKALNGHHRNGRLNGRN